MAGGHEVTGLLVGAITNLCIKSQLVTVLGLIQLLQGVLRLVCPMITLTSDQP